jgi:hypothetical protein
MLYRYYLCIDELVTTGVANEVATITKENNPIVKAALFHDC